MTDHRSRKNEPLVGSFLLPMKKLPLKSYLRHLRRRTGLSQEQLGFLLGRCSQSQVSLYERLKREPDLRPFLKCLLFFGLSGHEVYPALMEELEEELTEDARLLYENLQGNPSRLNNDRLDALEAFLDRDANSNQN